MDRNLSNVILLIVIIAFKHGVYYKNTRRDMKEKDRIFVVIVIANF
jgi:hypothetical protein